MENNHTLAPSPYVREWHEQVIEQHTASYPTSFIESLEQSEQLGIPIAPEYIAYYNEVSIEDIERLAADTKVDVHTQSITVAKDSRPTIYALGIDIDKDGKIEGDKGVFWGLGSITDLK